MPDARERGLLPPPQALGEVAAEGRRKEREGVASVESSHALTPSRWLEAAKLLLIAENRRSDLGLQREFDLSVVQ